MAKRLRDSLDNADEFPEIQSVNFQHAKKNAMFRALYATYGVVSPACAEAQIDRSTHYQWLKDDPVYREAVEGLIDVQKDFGEHQLFKAMKNMDTAAIIFYNKTKNRSRGYVEHDDLAGEGVPEWVISRIKKPE